MGKGKALLQNVIGVETYHRLRVAYRFYLDRLQGRQSLFIHTMGKVGSSTVAGVVGDVARKRDMQLYWTHFLTTDGLEVMRELQRQKDPTLANIPEKLKMIFAAGYVMERVLPRAKRQSNRIQVITLVRDPVAVNVSGFFQNYELWPDELQALCKQDPAAGSQRLIERFFATYPHHVPSTWFDMEIKPLFGIDVFEKPFPQEKGYEIYHSETADLLLIKLEQFDACAPEALATFLNIQNPDLTKANTAQNKWYADVYKAFKANLVLPSSYLDEAYSSRFATQFYTPEERAAFRKKWERTKQTTA